MDTMTYLIHKTSNLPKNRIIGMGGALDSARFRYFLATALECSYNEVEGIVIGGHGKQFGEGGTADHGVGSNLIELFGRHERCCGNAAVGSIALQRNRHSRLCRPAVRLRT